MSDASTINLNHNSAECIKSMTNWGESVIYNICSGSNIHIPWGDDGLRWRIVPHRHRTRLSRDASHHGPHHRLRLKPIKGLPRPLTSSPIYAIMLV